VKVLANQSGYTAYLLKQRYFKSVLYETEDDTGFMNVWRRKTASPYQCVNQDQDQANCALNQFSQLNFF